MPPKRCPDIATCHTSQLGVGGLVFCLNENRIFCDYHLPFGNKFFCTHPEITENADPAPPPAKGEA